MSVTQQRKLAPVAQLDRVSDYGSEGWGFESSRAYLIENTSSKSYRFRGFFFFGVASGVAILSYFTTPTTTPTILRSPILIRRVLPLYGNST